MCAKLCPRSGKQVPPQSISQQSASGDLNGAGEQEGEISFLDNLDSSDWAPSANRCPCGDHVKTRAVRMEKGASQVNY